MDRSACLTVGKITKAHGIRGEVKFVPYSGDLAAALGYQVVYMAAGEGDAALQPFTVRKSRLQGRQVIFLLAGVEDRSAAELLAGRELWIAKADLPAPEEDEFYWHTLVGMEVITEQGDRLGRVHSLFATGGHDVIVVRGGGREYLVPARREFIHSVDTGHDRLVITPIPGLLDMNSR